MVILLDGENIVKQQHQQPFLLFSYLWLLFLFGIVNENYTSGQKKWKYFSPINRKVKIGACIERYKYVRIE